MRSLSAAPVNSGKVVLEVELGETETWANSVLVGQTETVTVTVVADGHVSAGAVVVRAVADGVLVVSAGNTVADGVVVGVVSGTGVGVVVGVVSGTGVGVVVGVVSGTGVGVVVGVVTAGVLSELMTGVTVTFVGAGVGVVVGVVSVSVAVIGIVLVMTSGAGEMVVVVFGMVYGQVLQTVIVTTDGEYVVVGQ